MQCVQCGRILLPANLDAGSCPSCGAATTTAVPISTAPPSVTRTAQVAADAERLQEVGKPTTVLSLDIQAIDLAQPAPAPEPIVVVAEPVVVEAVVEAAPAPEPVAAEALVEQVVTQTSETVVVSHSHTNAAGETDTTEEKASKSSTTAETLVAESAASPAIPDLLAEIPAPALLASMPTSELLAEMLAPSSVAEMPAVAAPPTPQPTPVLPPTPIAKVFDTAPASQARNPIPFFVLAAVVVVVIITVLVFLLGHGGSSSASSSSVVATPTAVAAATPTSPPTLTAVPGLPAAPAGFVQFASGDGIYGLNYPGGWVTTTQNIDNGAGVTATAQAFISLTLSPGFLVVPLNQAIPPQQYLALIEANLKGVPGTTNVQIDPGMQQVTIGANSWTKITGTFDLQGTTQSAIALIAPHKTGTFALVFFAPMTAAPAAETMYFVPIAQSFTFFK